MTDQNHDRFLADVLRREKTAFSFAANPDYLAPLPGELVWVLICALVREKQLSLNQAARVVLEFTERNGEQIPRLLSGKPLIGKIQAIDAAETRRHTYNH